MAGTGNKRDEMPTEIWCGNMMGRGNVAGLGAEREVLLKFILKK
jgi:hypothetical protein